MKRIVVFLLALIVTYVIAAIASTQSVLARLSEMGIVVTLDHRIGAMLHDLVGMATTFLPLLAAGLLIAFLLTALVNRWVVDLRTPLYVLAGASAVIAVHVCLKLALDITPVAAARSAGGLVIQAFAGAIGGYVFAITSGNGALADKTGE
ncbi:MAG: hypothetical protein HKM98_02285 [Gammaproteobacteria bacterium]|nr:hypothetical protein [Gammaproteobacteria bacterium]